MRPIPPTATFDFYPDAITHGERMTAAHPGTGFLVETRAFGPDLNTVSFYAACQPSPVYLCAGCGNAMTRGWCVTCDERAHGLELAA